MPMKKCIVKCDTPSKNLFTIPTKDDVFNLWKIACGEHVKLTKGMYIYNVPIISQQMILLVKDF